MFYTSDFIGQKLLPNIEKVAFISCWITVALAACFFGDFGRILLNFGRLPTVYVKKKNN